MSLRSPSPRVQILPTGLIEFGSVMSLLKIGSSVGRAVSAETQTRGEMGSRSCATFISSSTLSCTVACSTFPAIVFSLQGTLMFYGSLQGEVASVAIVDLLWLAAQSCPTQNTSALVVRPMGFPPHAGPSNLETVVQPRHQRLVG